MHATHVMFVTNIHAIMRPSQMKLSPIIPLGKPAPGPPSYYCRAHPNNYNSSSRFDQWFDLNSISWGQGPPFYIVLYGSGTKIYRAMVVGNDSWVAPPYPLIIVG
jgi:hypothetical protein